MSKRRAEVGRDWVLLEWDGTIRCPYHGILPVGTGYEPGTAPCGCTFVAGPGGILRAQRATPADKRALPGNVRCENALT